MLVMASQISNYLGSPLTGPDVEISGVSSLGAPRPGTLAFAKSLSPEVARNLESAAPLLVLVPRGAAIHVRQSLSVIEVDRPRVAFAKAATHFLAPRRLVGICSTARLGANVALGTGVTIGSFCVIGDNVEIGDDTELRHHVVIASSVRIGKRCIVKSHAVIGEEGFGVDYDENGHTLRIPHFGGVSIGDDVEIGSGSTVCRGTLNSTVVSDRAKIDDHVHLGHNCEIGEDSIITACACIGGSAKLGRQTWVGLNANIMNGHSMGDRAFAGLGANVTKSVEPDTVVAGNPAKAIRKREGL